MTVVISTTIRFDSRGTTTAEVTCVPSLALLERIVALPGRRELTIEAPVDRVVNVYDAGDFVLAGVMDGTVTPHRVRFEADAGAPEHMFRRGDLVALRRPKPAAPLCRWAAIKPGQPWRLV